MRKIFFVLLAVFFSPLAFAQIHLLPDQADVFHHWLQFSVGRSLNTGLERNQMFGGFEYGFDYNVFDGCIGVQTSEKISDLTLETDWLPFQFALHTGLLRFGVGLLYHVQWYSGLYNEHDFIGNVYISWKTERNFYVDGKIGVSDKVTKIDVIEKLITKWDPMVTLTLGKLFAQGTEVYYKHELHTRYRYPSFCTPTYTLGIAQHLANVRIAAEGECTFRDQYATVNYLDSAILRITARFTL